MWEEICPNQIQNLSRESKKKKAKVRSEIDVYLNQKPWGNAATEWGSFTNFSDKLRRTTEKRGMSSVTIAEYLKTLPYRRRPCTYGTRPNTLAGPFNEIEKPDPDIQLTPLLLIQRNSYHFYFIVHWLRLDKSKSDRTGFKINVFQ